MTTSKYFCGVNIVYQLPVSEHLFRFVRQKHKRNTDKGKILALYVPLTSKQIMSFKT